MAKGKWIAAAALLLLVAAVGWYFASPAYTLNQMQHAADANDSEALASHIDFPALREDMKAEIMAQMMIEAQKEENEFGGLGLAFGSAMIGPMIDGMITPAGLRAAFLSKERQGTTEATEVPAGMRLEQDPIINRRGLSEFVVTSVNQPDGGMVFKRDGLSWKLSGFDLPDRPDPSPPAGD
jgi:hypothetical protein